MKNNYVPTDVLEGCKDFYSLEHRWAVVGFTYDRAKEIIAEIERECSKEIVKSFKSIHSVRTEFRDGTILQWVPARESSRGHKFGRMWCDKEIPEDVFWDVVRPCYYGRAEDIVWL